MLKQASLVKETVIGTRHEYRLDATGLQDVRRYLEQFWDTALSAFVALAEVEAAAAEKNAAQPPAIIDSDPRGNT